MGLKHHKNKQALAEIEEKLPKQKGTEKKELVKKRVEEVKKQGSKRNISVPENLQLSVCLKHHCYLQKIAMIPTMTSNSKANQPDPITGLG